MAHDLVMAAKVAGAVVGSLPKPVFIFPAVACYFYIQKKLDPSSLKYTRGVFEDGTPSREITIETKNIFSLALAKYKDMNKKE